MNDLKFITLSNSDKPCIVDAEDFQMLMKHNSNWSVCNDKFIQGMSRLILAENGNWTSVILSRIIMKADKNNPLLVDHINRNPFDNRKINLRLVTRTQNNTNRGPNESCRYKGIYRVKKAHKWCAQISINKKKIYGGYFNTKIEALKAYNELSKKYHGEFGYLNTIPEE